LQTYFVFDNDKVTVGIYSNLHFNINRLPYSHAKHYYKLKHIRRSDNGDQMIRENLLQVFRRQPGMRNEGEKLQTQGYQGWSLQTDSNE